MEDATIENGCLWAMPGGHEAGLKRRFRRAADGGTEFEELDDSPFPDIELVPLEASAGTLVILHGYLPHWSGPIARASHGTPIVFTWWRPGPTTRLGIGCKEHSRREDLTDLLARLITGLQLDRAKSVETGIGIPKIDSSQMRQGFRLCE